MAKVGQGYCIASNLIATGPNLLLSGHRSNI
jgi:hypothetical protein